MFYSKILLRISVFSLLISTSPSLLNIEKSFPGGWNWFLWEHLWGFLCHFRGHRCYFWGIKLNCFWIPFAFYLLIQHSHTARTVGICFFFIGRVVWRIFFYCHIWAFLRGCVCSEMLADGRCCEGLWVPSVVTWIQNEVKCHPRLWCQGL